MRSADLAPESPVPAGHSRRTSRVVLTRFARGLGVERGEGRLFAWSAVTLFLVGWASVSLTNLSETLFLKRVGVDRLPVVFLANGLLLVGTTYLVSRAAARNRGRSLLTGTFAILVGLVLVLWLLLLAHFRPVFVLLVVASKQLDAIALIAFWTVLGGMLHGRQAKRIYAPIIAGGTLGRIFGSFASGLVGTVLGVGALLPVSAGALGIACLLTRRMHSAAPPRLATPTPRRRAPPPAALRTFRPLWRGNRLFRLLAVSALLGGTLGPMLYFQFSYIVDAATRGTNAELRLLDLYAKLRGAINVGVLCLQLVGTSRIFRRIGVPLASTISPVIYLLGFLGLSTRLDLRAGIGAVGGTTIQDHAIQEPAQRILATLFPERVRAVATSLIEGPLQRTGGALGNLLVLGALAAGSAVTVGYIALPIACVWLSLAVVLWWIYPTLLLEAASSGPIKTGLDHSIRELVDAGTMRALETALVDPDLRRCRTACELIVEAPRMRALAAIARAIAPAPIPNRPFIVAALHTLLQRAPGTRLELPEAASALEPLLFDRDSLPTRERCRLIESYACLMRPDSSAAEVLERLLGDPAPAVRLAARVQRCRAGFGDPASRDLTQVVATALAGGDDDIRDVALEALRTVLLAGDPNSAAWQARVALVAERLREPADRARAAEVLADVSVLHGRKMSSAGEAMLLRLRDPDPRVRTAVLRFMGRARLQRQISWVIGRLASDNEAEAAAAASTLAVLGRRVVSALIDALHREKRSIREAVPAILQEIPLDAGLLTAAMDREIDRVHELLLRLDALRNGPVSELVLQRLDERIAESLQTALLLVSTKLREERIAALSDLLSRSIDGRGRAPLLEALEALLPPGEAERLIPLLEDGRSPRLAAVIAERRKRPQPTFEEAVRETALDRDRLTRTFLLATFDVVTLQPLGAEAIASGLQPELYRGHDHHGRPEDSMLKKVEIVLHLRALDLFAQLTTRELSELAGVVREETHPPGTAIVREGEFGDCLYLIVEGKLRVTRGGEDIGWCEKGEFFGEMSIFDGEARFATVTSDSRVRLLRLERTDLLRLMDEQPSIAIAICQTLSRHVRELVQRLEASGLRASPAPRPSER